MVENAEKVLTRLSYNYNEQANMVTCCNWHHNAKYTTRSSFITRTLYLEGQKDPKNKRLTKPQGHGGIHINVMV